MLAQNHGVARQEKRRISPALIDYHRRQRVDFILDRAKRSRSTRSGSTPSAKSRGSACFWTRPKWDLSRYSAGDISLRCVRVARAVFATFQAYIESTAYVWFLPTHVMFIGAISRPEKNTTLTARSVSGRSASSRRHSKRRRGARGRRSTSSMSLSTSTGTRNFRSRS